MTILIIEDDASTAEVLTLLLGDEGYPTYAVDTVKEALSYLAVEETPGLILLDVWLPDFSGLDFLEELDARYPLRPCPIVVVSAVPSQETRSRLLALRIADFVEKPFDVEHVLRVVSDWYPASLYHLIGDTPI